MLLEAHDHVHTITILLVVNEYVLVVAGIGGEADDATKDALTLHMYSINLLVDLLAQILRLAVWGGRPGISKDCRCSLANGRVGVELEEQ